MPILLTGDLNPAEQAEWLALLRQALPGETVITDRAGTPSAAIDIALVANPAPGALQGLPALRLIQSLWAGVDRLLHDATVPADVPLARMVDPAMNRAMAETALWAVLALQRDFFRYAAQQRAAQWQAWPQRRAEDTTVAVLGLGQMGGTVAQRLAANGHRVLGWSTRAAVLPGVQCSAGDDGLHRTLAEADVVINLLPLTPATTGLFNATTFTRMKAGAGFVNLARGGHVVDADLLAALQSGQVGHAVLDVFHTEPLPRGHGFWQHPRITVLPHAAAQTGARSAAVVVAANVRALREGRALAHRVERARGY